MEDSCFRIGNDLIEREIHISDGIPYKSVIRNKVSGMVWESDGKESLIALPGIDLKGSKVSFEKDQIHFQGKDFRICWEFRIFEGLAVIESRFGVMGKAVTDGTVNQAAAGSDGVESDNQAVSCQDYADGLGCSSMHVDLHTVTFFDRTDHTDYLLEEKEIPLYNRNLGFGCDGHIFILKEKTAKEECIVIKNAPCGVAHYNKHCADLLVQPISNIHICGSGIDSSELSEEEYVYSYPVAVGVCGNGESISLFRKYYEKDYQKKVSYIMSNTWGDRNCDKCVCEEFVLKEIQKAQQLGIDIVQIDDGWQKGITANSLLVKGGCWSGGYRASDPEFWQINPAKFPNGFDNIIQAANENNLSIGLWFSPDNYHNYEFWELDAQVMLGFYKQYGIRYFKIDGVKVVNRICEKNLVKMFTKVTQESEGNIVFNMDITNGMRFGYLFHKEIGDIFVENRYTDWGNYYPHNTLRNLWELSKYLPAKRLQMELLNHHRNQDKYHDILAPVTYDMDYLFAVTMAANPLVWMEMTELDRDSCEKLSTIIQVYKKYRDDFVEVQPILNRPSGFSLTGFRIRGKLHNYVLLFRELSESEIFDISVEEILATNDETAQADPVRLTKQRSYLFGICKES